MLSFLIATPLFIAIMTWILIMEVDEGDWLSIITGWPVLGLWMWLGIYNYRWLRWTKPVGPKETSSQKAG